MIDAASRPREHKIIVAVAPVGSDVPAGAANPLTPEAIAEEVAHAADAGASVVHLHVRDEHGQPTSDLAAFSRTLDAIRARCDIVIQGSTGGMTSLSLAQRCVALDEPRVETASLNMGSVNYDEGVYINTLPDIRYWAGRMEQARVRPELVIFEGGMIHNALLLAQEGCLRPPLVFALCLGLRGALSATPASLQCLHGLLPAGSPWGLIHHGMSDLSLLALALGMGATTVRVGFEDSALYAPGKVAGTNAVLVQKAVALIEMLGLRVADPAEARDILGIR